MNFIKWRKLNIMDIYTIQTYSLGLWYEIVWSLNDNRAPFCFEEMHIALPSARQMFNMSNSIFSALDVL